MADNTDDKTQATVPSAGTLNAVPYARFQEVNEARRQLEQQLAELQAERQQANEALLAEQNQWRQLAEERATRIAELEPEATRAAELEEALNETLAARIAEIPEDRRVLVPTYGTPQERLKWINDNAGLLQQVAAPSLDGAATGDTPTKKTELTAEQKRVARLSGMTDEQYAAYLEGQ